jgi:hypothetical protein
VDAYTTGVAHEFQRPPASRSRRTGILLIAGDKTSIIRTMADRLYDEYIEEIRKEGLI